MQNKSHYELPENDIILIKAINEDDYWLKEFGFKLEQEGKTDNFAIYDKIIEAYLKTDDVKH